MRVCLIYDGLFPYNIGGAERWYRDIAERLVADGHQVTYLTLRQWEENETPDLPGVRVEAVGPRLPFYVGGRRSILRPLVFGGGVLRYLLRHPRHHDVVHTASFPYFSLLAAGLVRPVGRYRLVVDWHEVWTKAYWRQYLGPIGGWVGWTIQRLCLQFRQHAFSFSNLHAERLRAEDYRGPLTVIRGLYGRPYEPPLPQPADPFVLFAGRHIPEKQVPALIPAIALARQSLPTLGAVIFGDGPDRPEVERLIIAHQLSDAVTLPGFVDESTRDATLRRALCLVLPSRREGYGIVVVEAAARGVPSIVVPGPDNAAIELIEDGVNGVIAPSIAARDLAAAILRVHTEGDTLRASTAAWFERNAAWLMVSNSVSVVLERYAESDGR